MTSTSSQPQVSMNPNQFNKLFTSSVREAVEEYVGETTAALDLLNSRIITAPMT
ncbi:hypothetical protein J6590_107959, partial [Homalodisca vitripennis]